MPRFYFHLYNDMDVPDEEGQDLPDLSAAQAFALEQARALVAAMATEEGRIALHHRIDIEDGQRAVLGTMMFRDAVKIEA